MTEEIRMFRKRIFSDVRFLLSLVVVYALLTVALFNPVFNSRMAPPIASAQVALPLGPYGNLGFLSSAQNVTATVPAFQMVGITTGSTAAAETLTTDTATNLCALFPFVQTLTPGSANWVWDWYVKNTGATNAITVAAGAGVTLLGTGTAAALSVRHFKVQLVNCTAGSAAANLYSLEVALF